MKRLILFLSLMAIVLLPQFTHADAVNHVVISEIQTGSAASASQEFVELYNPTDQPISLEGWQLQYRPAGATSSWTNRTSGGLHGQIAADAFYLIAPTSYLPSADAAFSSGLAAAGGSLRLVDSRQTPIDLVGWGTAVEFEGSAAEAPVAGGSIERLPGAANPTGGNGIDTDNNAKDFGLRDQAEAQSSLSPTELPGEILPSNPPSGPVATAPDPAANGSVYPVLQLNELLVDPVSPHTDAKDEFIELHNPNLTPVDLTGYVIKTGSNFHDSFSLPAGLIGPNGYAVFYSAQTKLSLTNTGGAAELLDPGGNVIDQSAEYDGSLPGLSFSRFGSDWQWTEQLTPGTANVFVAPPTNNPSTASKTAAGTKKSSTTKSSSKTSKVKAPKAVKVSKTGALAATEQRAGTGGKWLIIGLAALSIGYAIYEFRYDLQNYYILAKRKYGAWRTARAPAKRR